MILKKLILLISLLISSAAFAESTDFICQTVGSSFGNPTSVTVTVTIENSEDGIHPTTITASGTSFMQFDGFSHIVKTSDDQTHLLFMTQEAEHQHEMIIDIKMNKSADNNGETVATSGTGHVISQGFSRLANFYPLSNCSGILAH